MAYEKEQSVGAVEEEKGGDERILKDSRDGLKVCIDDEKQQRALMLDDLKFATLDQWPADIRSARENDVKNGPRPCLTIDQINQYITQVSNDMRANRPSIKTRPVDDVADPETAKVFQGLIRHIEDQSSAHIAYQTAGESAVTIGLGFFRIVAEYASDDSFNQELCIKRIPDTFSTYLSHHLMPDGSDADAGWVFEKVSLDRFKREYPKAKVSDEDFSGLGLTPTWKTENDIIVCEYFYKEYKQRELLFLANGETMYADEHDEMEEKPEVTGRRTTQSVTVHWCKHTGCEVLDKRILKGKYIPIVEVVGKEKIVEGKRHLWGLVRPAKDSLRAFNYWISALTEKMALTPKAPFVGAVGQFATAGAQWDSANVNNYSKLEYDAIEVNGNVVAAPRRQEPMQMEPAMAQMLVIMQNNVKSSLGMYKAAIGEAESQQSGKAILALKRESDTGTMHFGDNQAISIAHCGRILVDQIPHYYDRKRILRILGEDGKAQTAQIDPAQKQSKREYRDAAGKIKRIYNLGVGHFDVTVTVGPGYTTSRQEAATVMTELASTAKDPVSAAIMQYGAVKNSDFHGSEEIERMLKAVLPSQVQPQEGEQEPIPASAMQKIAQLTQGVQMMQQKGQELIQENQKLKSGEQAAMAKVQAQAAEAQAELQLKAKVQAEELRLAREKAEAEMRLKRDIAAAEHGIEVDKANRERKIQEEDRASKFQTEQRELEQSSMPQFTKSIETLSQSFMQAIQVMAQVQKESTESLAMAVAQAISQPKEMIPKFDKEGRMTGGISRPVRMQ